MEVKTESGGSFDAVGRGTQALGIIGTVLGGLATAGSGLLGMTTVNNNNGTCPKNQFVTREAFDYAQALDSVQTELSKEKSERYTDQAVIAQGEKDAAYHEKMGKDLLDIGVGVARMSEKIQADRDKYDLREQILNLKIQGLEDKLTGAIALEAERRAAGDQNLYGYVNATFVPGKLIMPQDSICPPVMPRYNSFTTPTTPAS